jgi:hypothetical protein
MGNIGLYATATCAANHEPVQLAVTFCHLIGFADMTRDRRPNTSGHGSEIAEV